MAHNQLIVRDPYRGREQLVIRDPHTGQVTDLIDLHSEPMTPVVRQQPSQMMSYSQQQPMMSEQDYLRRPPANSGSNLAFISAVWFFASWIPTAVGFPGLSLLSFAGMVCWWIFRAGRRG